jgi:hypothetical protein
MKSMPGFSAEALLHNIYQQCQNDPILQKVYDTVRPQQVDDTTRPPICDPEYDLCRRECQQQPIPLRKQCKRDCFDDFCFR